MTYSFSSPSVLPTEGPCLTLYLRDYGRQSFAVSNLIYLQAVANYSWLYWADGRRMLMPRTLKYYTLQLPNSWFVRLHRNCIVNLHYVHRLERTDTGGFVHLTTGEKLPISRRRWSTVRQQITYTSLYTN